VFKIFKRKYPIIKAGVYPIPAQYETNLRYLCIGIHDGWIYPSKEDLEIYWLYKEYFNLTN
jgi:hypothetical protein